MNRLARLMRVVAHPRELRMALSGLAQRLGGDDALGGLLPEETAAVVRWTGAPGVDTLVEVGTLFGLTAMAVARETGARVVAVDNFCWNPFGLTPAQHESFTRRVLSGSGVEVVRDDAESFLGALARHVDPAKTLVFLDGSHAYADVKREIGLCMAQGVAAVSGHDFGNSRFGVTRAVRETVGEPHEVCGMCWLRRLRA